MRARNQRAHCANAFEDCAAAVVARAMVVIYTRRRGGAVGRRVRNFNNRRAARRTAEGLPRARSFLQWCCCYGGRGWRWCENAITRIVCACVCVCACVRSARIITKYRELIKHIVGARRLDNRYKLPPREKQLTGETSARAYTRRGQYRRWPRVQFRRRLFICF